MLEAGLRRLQGQRRKRWGYRQETRKVALRKKDDRLPRYSQSEVKAPLVL